MGRPREFEPGAALELVMRSFWERGYRATSVDDLVTVTGVKAASLYAAFPGGKRGMFLAALQRYSATVVPARLGDLERPGAALAEVRGYLDRLVAGLTGPDGRHGCLMVNTMVERAADDDEVGAVVRGHRDRLQACVSRALATASERGELPPGTDPDAAARHLVTTVLGLLVTARIDTRGELLRATADRALASLG